MLERCLFCRNELGTNSVVESFPGAEQVAYDPARGRLWAVCRHCGRWSLTPIESRWEVLEQLERLTRDRGRLLGQTDNIGLFVLEDARIIRVGTASLREEAWWRYTREVGRRRGQARKIVSRGRVTEAMVSLFLVGFPVWGIRSPQTWIDRARRKRFGRHSWHGEADCERCGRSDQALELGGPLLLDSDPSNADRLIVRGYCRHCASRESATFVVPAYASDLVLRRSLAYENFSGVPDSVLDGAVRRIEQAETPARFSAAVARGATRRLGALPAEARVALEIAVNERHERELLALELEALEGRWRAEEEIAAIVDRELTPGPLLLRFLR